MSKTSTRLSVAAVLIALVLLPILSGSWDLFLRALVAAAVLLLIAVVVSGVNVQRQLLRQGAVDQRAIIKAAATLEDIYFSLVIPVIGADSKNAHFSGTARAVQILARHGMASIPMPHADAEIHARLKVLGQDPEFMSLLRRSATRGAARVREALLTAGSSMPNFSDRFMQIQQHLEGIQAVDDTESLVYAYMPAVRHIENVLRADTLRMFCAN